MAGPLTRGCSIIQTTVKKMPFTRSELEAMLKSWLDRVHKGEGYYGSLEIQIQDGVITQIREQETRRSQGKQRKDVDGSNV